MANAERDLLPKRGKVNEMCREWLVREDGALAYRLQNQEISEHYQGNKQRNALVREDFPKALDEQMREQHLAEQAALVYQQMLEEQEKIDQEYAKELAQKLEWEEKIKRQTLQMQDQFIAKEVHEEANLPPPIQYVEDEFLHSPNSPLSSNQNFYHCYTPRRQAKPMPLPSPSHKPPPPPPPPLLNIESCTENYAYSDPYLDSSKIPTPSNNYTVPTDSYAYSEVYKTTNDLSFDLKQLEINKNIVPADELIRRKLQEEKDAQLARELQERENSSENTQLDRDRLLAIEAQDKELAKLLQERERQKVKRARERAKQKSLMKKQQQKTDPGISHQDDSYSDPVDLVPNPQPPADVIRLPPDDIVSYSLPADVVKNDVYLKQKSSQLALKEPLENPSQPLVSPARPTNLNLKSSVRKNISAGEPDTSTSSNDSPSKQISNIAIAIDPTYNRRSQNFGRSSKGSPSVVPSNSSCSSSPNTYEDQETSPVPPYMPIQGQRRTSSLEKKHKKKVKDGCKQQ